MKWEHWIWNRKSEKLDKSKRPSYSPAIFKHGYTLKAYLEPGENKIIPEHLYFSKNSKIILIFICILISGYRIFY